MLAEFGCGWGKSVMSLIYAVFRFKSEEHHLDSKVFIANPNPWLQWQVNVKLAIYNDVHKDRTFEDLVVHDKDGICSILHEDLLRIPRKVIENCVLIIDEAHLLFADCELKEHVLKAREVFGISATFGGAAGLHKLKEDLNQRGALVSYYKSPKGMDLTARTKDVQIDL